MLAAVGGRLVPMPINRTTLNALYGLALDRRARPRPISPGWPSPASACTRPRTPSSPRSAASSTSGSSAATRASSGACDPSELDASVCARIPVRTNTDDRYFTDSFQAMPRDGYTAMFERMLDHPLIDGRTGVDFADVRDEHRYATLVWTGPIDEYFDHRSASCPTAASPSTHETSATPDGGSSSPSARSTTPTRTSPTRASPSSAT